MKLSNKIQIKALIMATLFTCAAQAAENEMALRADALRTPDESFAGITDFPYAPNYVQINGYRMHYVEQGSPDEKPVLMLHGLPTWSYLYRKMIPIVAEAGHRVIAPDLIGFGRSDKPKSIDTHSYAFHVEAMTRFIEALDLQDITLVVQDWGSLIGLRVAAENPQRFARIVIANGGLPVGSDGAPSAAFSSWRDSVIAMRAAGDMPVDQIMRASVGEAATAYAAPFPDPAYKAGPLALPLLVPVTADDPANEANRRAWQVFSTWEKPFLTAFSDGDPITRGGEQLFQQCIPGARGQKHVIIEGGGHFLQENRGEQWAQIIVDFIADNPL